LPLFFLFLAPLCPPPPFLPLKLFLPPLVPFYGGPPFLIFLEFDGFPVFFPLLAPLALLDTYFPEESFYH
jgi:hypothetical protein